ncbi:Bet v I domain-containing protein [Cynara cardunculus var. scolymus]|uniref:Bet v I domain-containing protein n=1 Tax=Cynara cardunculus var. scolymus TaxID=59895 RepID=A0A103XVJ0_CYNCS|nr:Bet v I domain-containing protein [Cynara cardunculus var. scolymus]
MALIGKLIMHQDISSRGDLFHDLIRHRPNDIATISPDKLHGCDILEGERGAVGSIICWDYTQAADRWMICKFWLRTWDHEGSKLCI